MNGPFQFRIDGVEVAATPGQTIMEAADAAGIYIPRLCDVEGLRHQGGCRVCTVKAAGRSVSACTQPAEPGLDVENDTEARNRVRRDLVEMLFHEGNHLCPICEKSGTSGRTGRPASSWSERLQTALPVATLEASNVDAIKRSTRGFQTVGSIPLTIPCRS